jgi:GNAT superfamily N-acetyltransferase
VSVKPGVRPAVLADLPALRVIHRRASLSNAGDRPHLLAHPDVLDVPEAPVLEGRTLVASVEGQIVGFATCEEADHRFELTDLFVDPGSMRQGVGRLLIEAVIGAARERDLRRIEVTANTHALAFYERVGFVDDGVRVETTFDPGLRMHIEVEPPRA